MSGDIKRSLIVAFVSLLVSLFDIRGELMPNTTASSEYDTLFTRLISCPSLDNKLVAELADLLSKQPAVVMECVHKNILQSNTSYSPSESSWRFTCATNVLDQLCKRGVKYDYLQLLDAINSPKLNVPQRNMIANLICGQVDHLTLTDLEIIAGKVGKESLILDSGPNGADHSIFYIVCGLIDCIDLTNSDRQQRLIVRWCLSKSLTSSRGSVILLMSSFISRFAQYNAVVPSVLSDDLLPHEKAIILISSYGSANISEQNNIFAELEYLSESCPITSLYYDYFAARLSRE
jgi:hypothetical protein